MSSETLSTYKDSAFSTSWRLASARASARAAPSSPLNLGSLGSTSPKALITMVPGSSAGSLAAIGAGAVGVCVVGNAIWGVASVAACCTAGADLPKPMYAIPPSTSAAATPASANMGAFDFVAGEAGVGVEMEGGAADFSATLAGPLACGLPDGGGLVWVLMTVWSPACTG